MWNYYSTLGIARNATRGEIVKAYRRLAMKWHPDRNPGNEVAAGHEFRKIRKAFDALSAARDDGVDEQVVDDGVARRPAAPPEVRPTDVPGANLRRVLGVPLEIALAGGEVMASFFVTEPCGVCKGASARVTFGVCERCGGRGTRRGGEACRACDGAGAVAQRRACGACRQTGTRCYCRRVAVPVPAGTWDGQTLVVKGEGVLGWSGGPRGDAIFSVSIACPPGWFRFGFSLMGDLHVDCQTAALGGPCEVEVLGRRLSVDIPPNCPPGKWLSLPGAALGDASGQRGCLYLRVVFSLPSGA
ncbi:hypothetical protein CY652_17115 [Burkholderia sp. WAC0059]|uniref:DnaJ domain-containing protein n=1 Tax=Burkholderia sp. WAC0059 TaxID=2066022 RepID=UPI000C7EBC27|nr:DnaJ domain-containing protein [Burkholderia sp. WAC0059]PLZ01261.1 hypothetical protein CY652_17115 [Burkholderia sp. WAC0059]